VLGANVGITISVQLLAFRLQDYSGIFLLAGGIGFLFLKRAIFRGAGQMLLGTGLLFLAMGIIGSAGTAAAANADLKLLFGVVDHYPLVVFIGTALLTVSLQSSTASIGLGIGLAQSGLLPRDDHRAMGVRCEPRNYSHDDDGRLGQHRGTATRYWKPSD